jgi:hypothetical protein
MGILTRTRATPSTVLIADASPLVELLPGIDLAKFYSAQTGCAPDPNYFGVYSAEAIGDTLYLGFGTARPAEANGSLLAKTDGNALTPVKKLDEQGFVGMRVGGDTLYIPGADPLEDWSLGEVYVGKPPDNQIKHRNMPNVIHTWGIYPYGNTGRLYAAVGQHAGDCQTFYGGVLISDDDGDSWEVVEDPRRILGKYRTYDITLFASKLYATANDDYERASALAVSSDWGATWKRVNTQVESRPRLLAGRDYLAALSWGRGGLTLISASGRVTRTKFDGFYAADWAYNYITPGYGGWYYMLGDAGRIYNSRDLKTWTLVADTGLTLLSISYWQTKNRLIVTDRGSGASVYMLDLAMYGAV